MPTTWKDQQMVRRFTRLRKHLPGQESYDVVKRLIADIGREPQLIVDLGSGTGAFSAGLLDMFADARLVMVDYSPTMLDAARAAHGGNPRITIIDADLTNTSMRELVGSARPDVVVSAFAIHHLTRQRQRELYSEVFDVLASGGVFVNAEHTASASPRHERMFYAHMADKTFENAQAAGDDLTRDEIDRMLNDGQDVNILTHVCEQCGWLRDIGYTDVDCAYKLYEMAVFAGYKP